MTQQNGTPTKMDLFIEAYDGSSLKVIAKRTGISYGYCRKLWSRQEVKDAVAARDQQGTKGTKRNNGKNY